MTSSRIPLIFAIFAFAYLFSSANAICLRNADGHWFNLCPFRYPFDISYNVMPYWSANMTFSLARADVPSCQNSTDEAWFSGVNSDGKCAVETETEPVFHYIEQVTGLPGVKIDYILDNNKGNITVNLLCNQTAPQNTYVDFFVGGVVDSAVVISGYSYYGCPIHF